MSPQPITLWAVVVEEALEERQTNLVVRAVCREEVREEVKQLVQETAVVVKCALFMLMLK